MRCAKKIVSGPVAIVAAGVSVLPLRRSGTLLKIHFVAAIPTEQQPGKQVNFISLLFRKLYEDMALGRLSNEQFALLTSGYEDEKAELTKRTLELRKEIDTAAERGTDVKRFVALVRRYSEISELTYENVHEFIDRILVHELDRESMFRFVQFFPLLGKGLFSGLLPTLGGSTDKLLLMLFHIGQNPL